MIDQQTPFKPQRAGQFAIRIPEPNGSTRQDQERCEIFLEGQWKRIRFHDYDAIYRIPGLYEALFYQRLKCSSPNRVVSLLDDVLSDFPESTSDLRVLDVGAGNGMVGQELRCHGVSMVFGTDILPEAEEAVLRDRPGVYDDYLVADLTELSDSQKKRLQAARLNCMTCVAALGFGDIPPAAFISAFNLIDNSGWLAFNIKEDFLDEQADDTGFCRLIRRLIGRKLISVQAMRRYRHRLSMHGQPLHYVAMVANKNAPIPQNWADEMGADS